MKTDASTTQQLPNRRRILALGLSAIVGGIVTTAHAANYPEKPITFIVPWSAGGATDAAARAVAGSLSTRFGQSVLVDNRTGASGMIGAQYVARSKPDGYTVLVSNVDTHVIDPLVFPKIRYDASKDFRAVIELGELPLVLVARRGLPMKTAADLIRMAKANPGRYSYGTWGVGSLPHIAFSMIESQTGTSLLHVPFAGVAPASTQILGGQIDLMLLPVTVALSYADKIQLIGLTSPRRNALYPDIPTLAEQGLPGYAAEQWFALHVPSHTPDEVVARLNAATNAYLKTAEAVDALKLIGVSATGGTAEAIAARQQRDIERWRSVIAEKKIVVSD